MPPEIDPSAAAPAATPSAAVPAAPVTAAPTPEAAPPVTPVVEAPAAGVEPPAAPVVEAAPAPEAPKPHTDTPSLLEEATKPKDAKPGAEPPKPTETVTEPVVAPTYEFQFPEGITPDAERMKPFTEWLTQRGVDQEAAQALFNMHTSSLEAYKEFLGHEAHNIFANTRAQWRTEVMADDKIGGAGHQTAMQAIARARDRLVPPGDMGAFNDFLRVTGAGDHPIFLRLLHTASRFVDEPGTPPAATKPPKDIGKAPGRKGMSALYDKSTTR